MDILDIIMKDDGLGFGDKVGCCPVCETPFFIPIEIFFSKEKPSAIPCNNCGQMIRVY